MPSLAESLKYQPTELSFGTSGLRDPITYMTDLEVYINTQGFIEFLKCEQRLAPGSVIYLAGDLRMSTPRIMSAVHRAVSDYGMTSIYGGLVPTPAISYYALLNNAACIMVTGSHIPDDRNGIKFYKLGGEVLKDDEAAIKSAIARVRQQVYQQDFSASPFDENGGLRTEPVLPPVEGQVEEEYIKRYIDVFRNNPLAGKKVVFYQHSAVGRELIPRILEALGAIVLPVDKSAQFVPIDTENITPDNRRYFKELSQKNEDLFAIVSTDGDSDRPFVVDENGRFHRGDELGAVVAKWLGAEYAALPISSNDAVDTFLEKSGIEFEHTKIGSPYVIAAMTEQTGKVTVGWEVNGGFLTGVDINLRGSILKALPTRDATLPIIVALISAAEKQIKLSAIFHELPPRFTQAGLIDNFPTEVSQKILALFSGDINNAIQHISQFFNENNGFGDIKDVNTLDGVRIYFDNGDIAHIRPSNNAPQLRIYSVANTQERADEIVRLSIAEPDGILRQIESELTD